MQFLLDRLAEFCNALGMGLNVKKCEILLFAGTQFAYDNLSRDVIGLSCAGKAMPIKERAKYLGLRYDPGFSFDSCRMELSDVGRKAVFALAHKLERNRIWVPGLMLRCFATQIRPILNE
jgi:hypothetical protein